ncbi:hypothetical protein JQ604_06020 [Bradyrhizobium jicamae]|uniref:hypothetical protein n=1 Tax=Bradyrhizobium jicamae TaxID=280332 RepID=UPI001BABACC8|nr:hypothetical protein [Bradyrhizobium jicamae]MBR0751732.1 hypothetical protein [Bradyrhizobium jicamae]
MYKYNVLKENLHVDWHFQKPIFSFLQIAPRFFAMLHERFGQMLSLKPGELHVNNGASSLGEARLTYRMYGGNSTVTLHADHLNFSVPGANPGELGLVRSILGELHDGFKREFPEIETGRVDVASYSHCDLGNVETVTEFLARFTIPRTPASSATPAVQIKPAVKFTATSEAGDWEATVTAEPSIQTSSAIFVAINLNVLKLPSDLPFIEKAAVIQGITARCFAMIDLELDNAAQAGQ